jgi:AcrR family transcriptional regulator
VAGTGNLSKERLLRASLEYVAEHGVADLSLRRLAAAIGTSHRMLIYHFESKAGLLIELIKAVEDQQRQTLAEFDVDPSMSSSEIAQAMWRQVSDPKLWPNERLFFEMYGHALQARPHAGDLLDDIVEAWVVPAAAMREAEGLAPKTARDQARLDVATTRGLLLDLLATGDRAGVDEAAEHYLKLYQAWQARSPARDGGDHLAALYWGPEERDAVIAAFRCSSVVDTPSLSMLDGERIAMDMGWAVSVPAEEVPRYESELDRITTEHGRVILCLYDLDIHGWKAVPEIMKTHTRVMLGGVVLEQS